MSKKEENGVFQLENGFWGYRFVIKVNGKSKAQKRVKDELGNPYKTRKQAIKARNIAIAKEQAKIMHPNQKELVRKTIAEVYQEYCDKGRASKAYATIKKQDSLWNNHIKSKFGTCYVDEITVAEINDYLSDLYYIEDRAYSYVESFLKMFYLILGQAYSRNYLSADNYNKLCKNKDTKIHMPRMKVDEDTDVFSFSDNEIDFLMSYFKDSNAETAFLLGRYCGLRINECYGLKWKNIDIENGIITIDRQMSYQDGLIKLVPLKTRNARRKIYMCSALKLYFAELMKRQKEAEEKFLLQRQQNQTIIQDSNGGMISSLELVNSLLNGKIQTVNSMKYHSRLLQRKYCIPYKYHYLRHTYGTNLAMLNTPIHLLCNQMGHANSKVTEKYYIALSQRGKEVLVQNLEQL